MSVRLFHTESYGMSFRNDALQPEKVLQLVELRRASTRGLASSCRTTRILQPGEIIKMIHQDLVTRQG